MARVRWFLVWLLGSAGALIVAACIVVLLVRHRFNQHHRVDPKIPTDAPLTWAVDPRTTARLHRRLARVGSAATAVAADHPPTGRIRRREESPVAVTARSLREQAVALDNQLARLAVLTPSARREPMRELARATAELEVAATRLVAYSAEVRTPRQLVTDDPTIVDIQGQLDRLAEAHRELESLEQEVGLVAPTLPGVPTAANPRPPDATQVDATQPDATQAGETTTPTDRPSPGR